MVFVAAWSCLGNVSAWFWNVSRGGSLILSLACCRSFQSSYEVSKLTWTATLEPEKTREDHKEDLLVSYRQMLPCFCIMPKGHAYFRYLPKMPPKDGEAWLVNMGWLRRGGNWPRPATYKMLCENENMAHPVNRWSRYKNVQFFVGRARFCSYRMQP